MHNTTNIMPLLLSLPTELLQWIVDILTSVQDINALVLTNKHLYELFNLHLYRYDALHENSSALLWAAEHGNQETLHLSLSQGADISTSDEDGKTPLILATQGEDVGMVQALLATPNIDVNAKDHLGWTALMFASAFGLVQVMELLLNDPRIDVNCVDEEGSTPLIMAASSGHDTAVKLLLAADGIDVDREDNHGWTALWHAVSNGHEDVVRSLVTRVKDVDLPTAGLEEGTPLIEAVEQGHIEVVRVLLEAGADPNFLALAERGPLSFAAQNGHAEIITLLREAGATLYHFTDCNWTELGWAASEGHVAAVEALLGFPNLMPDLGDLSSTRSPLFLAAENGYEEVVRVLVACEQVDANFPCGQETALIVAADRGQEKVVAVLLACERVDATLVDGNGKTARDRALEKGHHGIVSMMDRLQSEMLRM